MQEWLTIGGGAQDILDDVQLFNTVQSFLDTETEQQYMGFIKSSLDGEDDNNNPIAARETLLETKRSLKLTFGMGIILVILLIWIEWLPKILLIIWRVWQVLLSVMSLRRYVWCITIITL